MTDLEEQLNSIGENTEVQEPTEPQTEVQTPENIQTQTDEPQQDLWKQTKQFVQGLWKSPDDIYNSVKYYEQKFQPLEQSLRRMGFKEPADLENAYKEYQEKLPTYQQNEQTINLLNALLQDEVYGSKLKATFDEIRRSQEQARYGIAFDQLPQVIQEKVQKGEQAFQQLEELKQQQAYENNVNTIQDQMAQIEKIVEETGLEFDSRAFLEYCRDNDINPANMKGEFLNSHYAQMLEKAKQSASQATIAQQKQNKAKAVNTSSKQNVEPPKAINSFGDLENEILSKL